MAEANYKFKWKDTNMETRLWAVIDLAARGPLFQRVELPSPQAPNLAQADTVTCVAIEMPAAYAKRVAQVLLAAGAPELNQYWRDNCKAI